MSRRDEDDSGTDGASEDMLSSFDPAPFEVVWIDGHLSEDSAYAWLDGALSDTNNALVEQHVQACAQCSAVVAEARGYIAASVHIMNAADLSPSVAKRGAVPREDVVQATARILALANGASAATPRASSSTLRADVSQAKQSRRWHQLPALRVAAAAVVMATGVYVASRDRAQGEVALTSVSRSAEAPRSTNAAEINARAQATSVASSPATTSPSTTAPVVTPSRAPTRVATQKPAEQSPSVNVAVAKTAADSSGTKTTNTKSDTLARSTVTSALGGVPLQAMVTSVQPSTGLTPATPPAPAASPIPSAPVPQTLPGVVISGSYRNLETRAMGTSTASVADGTTAGRTISGRVVDKTTNEPIGSVAVVANGTTLRAQTDSMGRFVLPNVPADVKNLRVMRIGYQGVQVNVDDKAAQTVAVDVAMQRDEMRLSEVVVTSADDRSASRRNVTVCWALSSESLSAKASVVQRVQIVAAKDGKRNITLFGWPEARNETRGSLTQDSDGVWKGNVNKGKSRLEMELHYLEDSMIGKWREFRDGKERTEKSSFTRDVRSKGCS